MAQRHWLDPLARQLLIASGQLPRSVPVPGRGPAAPLDPDEARAEAIERDLLALKLAQEPGRRLCSAAEVRQAAALGWRLDVNRATAADWLRLPGCRSEQVDLLLRLQAGGVQLSGPEDLQQLLELSEVELNAWLPLLEFRWYGTTPPAASNRQAIAINQAGARQLELLPGITSPVLNELLRQRASRPFADLADLQQRLQLSVPTVESWIGRVSFQLASAGPALPTAQRPNR